MDLSAVFGNPMLGPSLAAHASLGESLRITETLTFDVMAFGKTMSGLAVRSPAATPELAQALVQQGEGRAYGLQILVRQREHYGLSGWVTYTISRSERRGAPGETWRLFDYDQPHALTVVATKAFGPWSVGARMRVASGFPRTPVVGATYDAQDDRFDPLLGPQNSIRLPAFWQVDARVDRSFALGNGVTLRLYAEGLNVTGHVNGEEYAYNLDYSRRGLVAGLPFIALVGARLEL
jgi:hypothetical protein